MNVPLILLQPSRAGRHRRRLRHRCRRRHGRALPPPPPKDASRGEPERPATWHGVSRYSKQNKYNTYRSFQPVGCQAEEEDLGRDRGDTHQCIEHAGGASSDDGGSELVQGKSERHVHSEEHQ